MERPLDYSKCARPGCEEDEGRIDNYCSVYCRDIDELNIEIAQLDAKYNELIFSVANKYPDETRHETALRYIQEREQRVSGPSEVSECAL